MNFNTIRDYVHKMQGKRPKISSLFSNEPLINGSLLDQIVILSEEESPTFPAATEAGHLVECVITEEDLAISPPDGISSVLPAEVQPSLIVAPLPPEEPWLVLHPEDVPEPLISYLIDYTNFVQPTLIARPGNQTQVGQQKIEIAGHAEPGSRLKLHIGEFEQEIETINEGSFTFSDIELADGWNNIYVLSLTHPTLNKCHTVVQVYRQALPYIGHVDIYTRSPLTLEDEVVRCRVCRTYSRFDSWQQMGHCATWRCPSNQYWSKDDPEFYLIEDIITM